MPASEPTLVQYYLVDRTLHMRQGKTAAQCAHGALYAEERVANLRARDPGADAVRRYDAWRTGDMVKIVLRATLADLERALAEFPDAVEVRDRGFTEVAPDTRTVVVLPVVPKEAAPDWLRGLPLL